MGKTFDAISRLSKRLRDAEDDDVLIILAEDGEGNGTLNYKGDMEDFENLLYHLFSQNKEFIIAASNAATRVRKEIESNDNQNVN